MDAVERLSRKVASERTVLASEHRHRYEVAARLCAGMRVADVCCGTGYGTEIVNEGADSVTGVDVDAGAIEAARADLGGADEINFECKDAMAFLRQDLRERFDGIIMFEGLEHLKDPQAALRELLRHSRDGLKLILSVPNSRAFEEGNPFHHTDYGYEEMRAAFGDFEDVTLLYQFLAEGSMIRSQELGDSGEPAGRFDLLDHGELEYANHFIACIGFGNSARLGSGADACT